MTDSEAAARRGWTAADAQPAKAGLLGGRVTARTAALVLVLLLAAAYRAPGVFEGLPFSYYGDELHLMKRAMAMGTGDLNPHWFHKPALTMYLLLACYGAYFVAGALAGVFPTVDSFGAHFLSNHGPFLLIGRLMVCAFGVAAVYAIFRIAERAYGRLAPAVVAGALGAVLLPMALSSQNIKEDAIAGFFIALAALFYLRADGRGWAPVLLAGAAAGAAMGTKYYGVLLLPTLFAMEAWRALAGQATWRLATLRALALTAAFVATFFVTSPYNFLDPTWGRTLVGTVSKQLSTESGVAYDPDDKKTYKTGLAGAPAAFAHVFEELARPKAFGPPLTALAALGFVLGLVRRSTRWATVLLGTPLLAFAAIAAIVAPHHAHPRHFNAVFPLLCPLAAGGAFLLFETLRLRPQAARFGGMAVAALAVAYTGGYAALSMPWGAGPDSRTAAYEWIVQNLRGGERILVEDYGPILQPNPEAVARLKARLATFPQDEPFTAAQGARLSLLQRYPPKDGLNIDELGHSWWSPRELSEEDIRSSWRHRDMGNPLIERRPKMLAEYRAAGVRYVVTNSDAQAQILDSEEIRRGYPSFVRFYEELAALQPIQTFDPAQWGGSGPVIWIYDLSQAPPAR